MKPILLLVGVVFLSGCATPLNFFHKVSAVVKTPTTQMKQVGDAAQPATVTTSTTKNEFPIPWGAKVVVEMPSAPTPAVPPPIMTTSTTIEHVVGPTSFQPPAPPTAGALADANVKIWFWIGLAVGVAAAIFGLVRDWNLVMYGGIAVAGACAFAIFVQAHPLVFVVIGLGIALKFAGPWFWHTQLKNKQPPTTTPP